MKIKKNYLLLLAGIVWLAAGFNILRIGIISYKSYVTLINLALSAAVFFLFWFMVFGNWYAGTPTGLYAMRKRCSSF